LCENGWLVVSPSEYSQELFPGFTSVNFPGAILYRKTGEKERLKPSLPLFTSSTIFRFEDSLPAAPEPPLAPVIAVPETPPLEVSTPDPYAAAAALYEQGHYDEATETLLASFATPAAASPQAFPLLARALANQGRLADALAWCDRWLAADKLDATGHYLRAIVSQELGDLEQARASLQRTVYLNPDFVLAHFALGNLAREKGSLEEAEKHFANALRLLGRCPPGEIVPESEGLTTARLTEIIQSLSSLETAS
jgi:chemotaxis protein methyltransferase CheR